MLVASGPAAVDGQLFTVEEVCLVLLVLLLWAASIALFINRWGKIRMLEPCLPYKLATLGENPIAVQQVSTMPVQLFMSQPLF